MRVITSQVPIVLNAMPRVDIGVDGNRQVVLSIIDEARGVHVSLRFENPTIAADVGIALVKCSAIVGEP